MKGYRLKAWEYNCQNLQKVNVCQPERTNEETSNYKSLNIKKDFYFVKMGWNFDFICEQTDGNQKIRKARTVYKD